MSSRTAARTRPAGSKRQCARAAGRGISHQRQVRLAVHLQILTQSSLSIRCFCDLNVSPPRYSGGHWFVSHLLAPQSAEQVGYAGRGGRAAIPGPIGANRSNFHSGLVPCARSVPLVSARQTFAIGRQCDLNEAVGLIAGGRPGHSARSVRTFVAAMLAAAQLLDRRPYYSARSFAFQIPYGHRCSEGSPPCVGDAIEIASIHL